MTGSTPMIRAANLSFLTCNLCPQALIITALDVRVGEMELAYAG